MGHVQSGDFEEAYAYVWDTGDDPLALLAIDTEYRVFFRSLAYDIEHESVSGDKASVTLAVAAADFAFALQAAVNEAMGLKTEETTEESLYMLIEMLLYEKMTSDRAPTRSVTLQVALERRGGEWKIIACHAFADAVTGGILNLAQHFGVY
jgi:hypothetical protein